MNCQTVHKGAVHGSTSWFHSLPRNVGNVRVVTRGGSGLVFPRTVIRGFQQLSLSLESGVAVLVPSLPVAL